MDGTRTYEALLHGDTVEWKGDRPEAQAGQPLPIQITVHLPEETEEEQVARKRRLREALERLAERNPFRDIPDAVEWQREIRKDRPLPGRDE